MTTMQEHPLTKVERRRARKAREQVAQAKAQAKVYVAPCNRLASITPICLADQFRDQLDDHLVRIVERQSKTIEDFKVKMDSDAFYAFDWSGDSVLEAAGKQRAAKEVQAGLSREDALDDGYQGGNNLTTITKLARWMTTEITNKVRFGKPNQRELARLAGLAGILDETHFTFYQLELSPAPSRCEVQNYDGWSLDDDSLDRFNALRT